jgi:hypothetical protein
MRLIERARAAEQGVDLTALPATTRSKYERALVALSSRAKEGDWSREQYEAELFDILSRAKEEVNAGNANDSPVSSIQKQELVDTPATEADFAQAQDALKSALGGASSETRTKYERAMNALISRAQRAKMTRTAFANERDQLIERARQEASTGQATDADFSQAQKTLESALGGASSATRTKYERAMNALISRAQKAGMTRAAFANERDQLIERARQEQLADNDAGAKEPFIRARRVETAKPLKREEKPVSGADQEVKEARTRGISAGREPRQ